VSTKRITLAVCVVLAFVLPTYASSNCGVCPSHYVSKDSYYPFEEGITSTSITVGNSWTTMMTGCTSSPMNGINLHSGAATNVLLRAYLQVSSATALTGARYEVRFVRKNPGSTPGSTSAGDIAETYGWYVRGLKAQFPQSEHFNSTIQNIASGQHMIELQARTIDSGSITFNQEFLTMQGAPSDGNAPGASTRFPSAKAVSAPSTNITSSWAVVSPTLTFKNTAPVNIQAQAYFEINGGTAGDQITVGFQLDSESPSRRNSDFAVPATANGYALREGVNIYDHIENVTAVISPGTHTLKLWAIDRVSGHTVPISNVQIEFASFPTNAYASGANFNQFNETTTVSVNSSVAPSGGVQPNFPAGDGCGYWYNLGEFTMPSSSGEFLWTGDAYIELLGQTAGTWTAARAEIAVEVYDPGNPSIAIDMHWVTVTIPAGRGHIYFDMDAFNWGNLYGNKVRLWIRKITCSGGTGTFSVGKRYLSMNLIPMDNTGCFYTAH
jgi:hypothetical protein